MFKKENSSPTFDNMISMNFIDSFFISWDQNEIEERVYK